MAPPWVRHLLFSRPVRNAIGVLQRIVPPGFDGFSLYHVSRFFFHALAKGNIINRAAAIAFRIFMALFPAIIVLLTLIPFIPIPDFQDKLLGAFQTMLPDEVYRFIEGLLHDLVIRKHSALLSASFVVGIFLASNSVIAILQGFQHSTFVTDWYKPWKQRLISLLLLVTLVVVIVLATGIMTATSWGRQLMHENYDLHFLESIGFGIIRWLTSVLLVLMAISLLYHAGTPGKRKFQLFTPGALLTVVLIFLLSKALAFVFTNITNYNALYGSIGVILAVQVWLYANMIVLLVGYELNTSIEKARLERSKRLRLKEEVGRPLVKG